MSIFDTYVARLAADARSGKIKSIKVTLSGTAGTVTSVTVPDSARGVRMYPDKQVRFAVDENPAAEATSSSTTVTSAALATGGYAAAAEWEARLLEEYNGAARTVRLMGAIGSEVVLVEFF